MTGPEPTDVAPDTRPHARPDTRPHARSEARPDTRSEARPEARSEAPRRSAGLSGRGEAPGSRTVSRSPAQRLCRAGGLLGACLLSGLLCTAAALSPQQFVQSGTPVPLAPDSADGPDWQTLFRLWSGAQAPGTGGQSARGSAEGTPSVGSRSTKADGSDSRDLTASGATASGVTGAGVTALSGPGTGHGTAPDGSSALPGRVGGTCRPSDGVAVTTTPATRARTVALTFDDGPSAGTPAVLDVLRRKGVHATFFVVGERAARDRQTVARIAAEGNLVANHTWSHPVRSSALPRGLDSLSGAALAQEIDRQSALIESITGRRVCFLRGPQGNDDSPAVRAAAGERHLTVTDWSVTTKDYLQPSVLDASWADRIAARAVGRGPHPIILLHDGGKPRPNTVAALERIITWYQSRGYTFTDPLGRAFPVPSGS
ncbi:MAG: peptidoglycan-N-acetylglucosamine deacetylase [Actinomycetota bacterium]|nr:peptidoglycan-N-acetylglucosamine deacetylase [Actinomycetota bacterium]